MSLKHIMLGVLVEPHSGYECRKKFEQTLSNFWHAELSQIYPLLQKMEKDGLLTSQERASEIGPAKRVYRRTPKGREELLTWFMDGPTLNPQRISHQAQVFFLAELEDHNQALEFMQQLQERLLERLAFLESAENGWRESDPAYPDNLQDQYFYPQLTLAMGLQVARARVEWCRESIERIEARQRMPHKLRKSSGGITQ